MSKKLIILTALVLAIVMSLSTVTVFAGGDKNTNRGSEGEQIGEPAPDPSQDPDQTRTGDPNPDQDNVPPKP